MAVSECAIPIKFVISPEVQHQLTDSVEWVVSSYILAGSTTPGRRVDPQESMSSLHRGWPPQEGAASCSPYVSGMARGRRGRWVAPRKALLDDVVVVKLIGPLYSS